MWIDALTMIAGAYDNVGQYIKLNHIVMNDSDSPGLRAQYQELVDSAQTVDLLIRQYSDAGKLQDDLKNDNIFAFHMATIALRDCKTKTNNVTGAQFVSGRGLSLLSTKIAEKAANYTNSRKKLENNLGMRKGRMGGPSSFLSRNFVAVDTAFAQCTVFFRRVQTGYR